MDEPVSRFSSLARAIIGSESTVVFTLGSSRVSANRTV